MKFIPSALISFFYSFYVFFVVCFRKNVKRNEKKGVVYLDPAPSPANRTVTVSTGSTDTKNTERGSIEMIQVVTRMITVRDTRHINQVTGSTRRNPDK